MDLHGLRNSPQTDMTNAITEAQGQGPSFPLHLHMSTSTGRVIRIQDWLMTKSWTERIFMVKTFNIGIKEYKQLSEKPGLAQVLY